MLCHCSQYKRAAVIRHLANLEDSGGRAEIDDLNVAFCSASDQERILNIHGINSLCQLDSSNWIRGTQVPIL